MFRYSTSEEPIPGWWGPNVSRKFKLAQWKCLDLFVYELFQQYFFNRFSLLRIVQRSSEFLNVQSGNPVRQIYRSSCLECNLLIISYSWMDRNARPFLYF